MMANDKNNCAPFPMVFTSSKMAKANLCIILEVVNNDTHNSYAYWWIIKWESVHCN